MAKSSSRLHPVSKWQLDIMVNYMEENEDLCCGKLSPAFTREMKNVKWEVLADKLNRISMGCPKSVTKWQRTWIEWKSAVKRKARNVNDGHCPDKFLSPLEERALTLFQKVQNNMKRNLSESEDLFEMSQSHYGTEADISNLNQRIEDEQSTSSGINASSIGLKNIPYAVIEDAISAAVKGVISSEIKDAISAAIKDGISERMKQASSLDVINTCSEPKVAYTGTKHATYPVLQGATIVVKEEESTDGLNYGTLKETNSIERTSFIRTENAISTSVKYATCPLLKDTTSLLKNNTIYSAIQEHTHAETNDLTSHGLKLVPVGIKGLASTGVTNTGCPEPKEVTVAGMKGDNCTEMKDTIYAINEPSLGIIYVISPGENNTTVSAKNLTPVGIQNAVSPFLKEVTPASINKAGSSGIKSDTPVMTRDSTSPDFKAASTEINDTSIRITHVNSLQSKGPPTGVKDDTSGLKETSFAVKEEPSGGIIYIIPPGDNNTSLVGNELESVEIKNANPSALKGVTTFGLKTATSPILKGTTLDPMNQDSYAGVTAAISESVSLAGSNSASVRIKDINSTTSQKVFSSAIKKNASIGVKRSVSAEKYEAPSTGVKTVIYPESEEVTSVINDVSGAINEASPFAIKYRLSGGVKKSITRKQRKKKPLSAPRTVLKKDNIWTALQKRRAATAMCLATSKKQEESKPSSITPGLQELDVNTTLSEASSVLCKLLEVNINPELVKPSSINATAKPPSPVSVLQGAKHIDATSNKSPSATSKKHGGKIKTDSERKKTRSEQHTEENGEEPAEDPESPIKIQRTESVGGLPLALPNSILERLDTLNRNLETNTCALTILAKSVQDSAETNMRAINNLSKVINNLGSVLFSSAE